MEIGVADSDEIDSFEKWPYLKAQIKIRKENITFFLVSNLIAMNIQIVLLYFLLRH